MKHRAVAVLLPLALVAAACGSRADDSAPATTTTVGAPADTTTTETTEPAVPMVGTLVSPCGPGDATGTFSPGVTDDTITVGTIADIGGPVPGLGQEMWDAMDAFAAYCNSLGGINGRTLQVTHLDSEVFKHHEATLQGCQETFALVGSGAAFDDGGAQDGVDCGIPDVAGYTTNPKHALATNIVQPLPNPTNKFATGPGRYIADQFPDAITSAGEVWVDILTGEVQARRQMEALGTLGFDYVKTSTVNVIEPDFTSAAIAMKNAGVRYLNFVGEGRDAAKLAVTLRQQSYFPDLFEMGPQAYNDEFLEAGGDAVEGMYILATTTPFEEADTSPATQLYIDWLEQTAPGAAPDALGVQAFSAGLLFATAAKAAGSNLTRETLFAELRKIHEWDGGGLHGTSDPGAGTPSGCFAYLKVDGAKFARVFPDEGFECQPDAVIDLQGDYGKGAGT